MKLSVIFVLLTAVLLGCSPAPIPDECRQPTDKPPIEGGIGGTGNKKDCED